MRVRVKTDGKYDDLSMVVAVVGSPGPPENHVWKCFKMHNHSHMADETNGRPPKLPIKGKRCPRVDTPCVHKHFKAKVAGQWPSVDIPWYLYPGLRLNVNLGGEMFVPFGFFGPHPPDAPDVLPSFRSFLRDSSTAFQQQFESKVSLANFLYELKDFRRLSERFLQVTQRCVAAKSVRAQSLSARSFRKALADEKDERLRGGAGSIHLDLVFNWKQLIRDIPLIGGTLGQVMDRLNLLIGMSQFQSHRRRRYLIAPETEGFDSIELVDFSDFSGAPGWTYKVELIAQSCQVTFNASARLQNDVQASMSEIWTALADALGLNNSPKILWNATKLSWLVDFFVDSRGFFDAFEKQAFAGHLGIQGGTASYKIERVYTMRITRSGEEGLIVSNVGSVIMTDYSRETLQPLRKGLFALEDSLDLNQKFILASLADSKTGFSGWLATRHLTGALQKPKRLRAHEVRLALETLGRNVERSEWKKAIKRLR